MRAIFAAVLFLASALPAQAEDGPLHLFLHFTDAAPANFDAAVRVGLALQADGFDVVDLRPVEARMRATTIRFFDPELRGVARRLGVEIERLLANEGADSVPVRVQDFTFYRPKPPPHSLEVWFRTREEAEARSGTSEPGR